ncbi:MAG: hypothetical protein QOI94_723 [Acidobacteriaceae bacterium]|jgi:hypothetical protein|nr:hypothetical protein [Acidobacteriaceae bacterium]
MLHPNATWCQVRLAAAVSLTSSNSGIKPELEEAVSTMPFEAVHIFRPGLLLGHRNESQPAESLVAKLAPLYSCSIPARVQAGIWAVKFLCGP